MLPKLFHSGKRWLKKKKIILTIFKGILKLLISTIKSFQAQNYLSAFKGHIISSIS